MSLDNEIKSEGHPVEWFWPMIVVAIGAWIVWHFPAYTLTFTPWEEGSSQLAQTSALFERRDVSGLPYLFGFIDPIDLVAMIALPIFFYLGVKNVRKAGMEYEASARLELQKDLRKAFDQNELELYFQPKVAFKTGALDGAEALLRWQHPEKGMIGPTEFIDVVERQAEAKTEGTEYDVIKIRGSIYLYDDHFDMYPKHWAHGYQRASMITELFPSFSRLRKITGLVDESEESLDSHILSAARKRTVSLESVFDKLEDEEAGVLEIDRYEMKDRDFAFIASVLAGRAKNLGLDVVDECFIEQKERNFEFSGFYSWMEKQKGRGDVVSDFARDMLNDKSFPKSAKSLKEVLNYLKSNSPFHYIDDEVEIAVRTSWIEFVSHEN